MLFNCSTNIVGGGIKNSAFFIKKALENKDFKWFFAISPQVNEVLNSWDINTHVSNIFIFKDSPSRSRKSRKDLFELTISHKIDLVYTMAGPAYVSFPCKHLQGLSNPYITHGDWNSFRLKGDLFSIARYYIYVFVQFLYSVKSDYFVFQTNFAKKSYRKRTGIAEDRLFVVSNAFDTSIREYFSIHVDPKSEELGKKIIRIFCPGAAYAHKGFQFLPKIIKELNLLTDKSFKFILTLPSDSSLWIGIQKQLQSLELEHLVENIGPYNYSNIKILLSECDIVFVPSLLETFSASYLEAMCAKKKLVVANKMYAKDICGKYAIYIDPLNAKNTASIFNELFNNYQLSHDEVLLADKILENYGSQDERTERLIEFISEILDK